MKLYGVIKSYNSVTIRLHVTSTYLGEKLLQGYNIKSYIMFKYNILQNECQNAVTRCNLCLVTIYQADNKHLMPKILTCNLCNLTSKFNLGKWQKCE